MLPFVDITCPYCGELITVFIDDSAGDQAACDQNYIEDCQVCCRPIVIAVRFDNDGVPQVSAAAEDEA